MKSNKMSDIGVVFQQHCVKSVRSRSFSGPYFPAFRLNTGRYSVYLRIQSKCGKIRTRITTNTDTFHTVRKRSKNTTSETNAAKITSTAWRSKNWLIHLKIFFLWLDRLSIHYIKKNRADFNPNLGALFRGSFWGGFTV